MWAGSVSRCSKRVCSLTSGSFRNLTLVFVSCAWLCCCGYWYTLIMMLWWLRQECTIAIFVLAWEWLLICVCFLVTVHQDWHNGEVQSGHVCAVDHYISRWVGYPLMGQYLLDPVLMDAKQHWNDCGTLISQQEWCLLVCVCIISLFPFSFH